MVLFRTTMTVTHRRRTRAGGVIGEGR